MHVCDTFKRHFLTSSAMHGFIRALAFVRTTLDVGPPLGFCMPATSSGPPSGSPSELWRPATLSVPQSGTLSRPPPLRPWISAPRLWTLVDASDDAVAKRTVKQMKVAMFADAKVSMHLYQAHWCAWRFRVPSVAPTRLRPSPWRLSVPPDASTVAFLRRGSSTKSGDRKFGHARHVPG